MNKDFALYLMAMVGVLGMLIAWMAAWPIRGKPSCRLVVFMAAWAGVWLVPPLARIWIAGMLG